MTVAEQLALARKAHEEYRRNIPHMRHSVAAGKAEAVTGDESKSIAALREALRLRIEADAQDPEHLDPAWQDDRAQQYRNETLVRFYTEVLARGEAEKV
jgi:hypothetical protein